MASPIDPAAVGLKVGLEIHQQLGFAGSRKLFCACPAEVLDRQPDVVVHRTLRAAAGETGEVDVAAAAEATKAKRFAYGAHLLNTCLVELDEEPPHPCDPDSLLTVLMVAKACESTILPRVQFMRKTIADGSNVSGFQRTGLVALGGTVPGTNVRIQTVALEEDAAKIVARTADEDTYDLSRLGIPLIELATEPDITTPEQAKETASQIGMLLRSTRRVKRGLGTIRQDLNVSIAGGARIEIKGCQDLRLIPQYVENEIRRQQGLLALATRLKATPPRCHDPLDVTDLFAHSTVGFVKKSLAGGAKAVGIRVEHFAGICGTELLPNYRVGTELAGIARSRGFGGLIHSDEDLAKYGADAAALKARFGCASNDAFLILIGDPVRVRACLTDALVPRIAQLAIGVPKEVRKAEPDATTTFLRPMPGGARMYPETDIPLVTVDATRIPPVTLLTEQVAQLARKEGISRDLAKAAIEQDIPIEDLHARYPLLSAGLIASSTIEWPREMQTRFGVEIQDPVAYVEPLYPLVESGGFTGSAIKMVLEEVATAYKSGHTIPPSDVLSIANKYQQLSEDDVRAHIRSIIRAHPGVSPGGLMGLIMKELRGKADGKLLDRLLREEMAKSI